MEQRDRILKNMKKILTNTVEVKVEEIVVANEVKVIIEAKPKTFNIMEMYNL